jgi:mono/diheme cytochrome c family protein
MSVRGRKLHLPIIILAMTGTASAQNIDQGKSGAELFAAHCAECHRSPRGLVKHRFSWTLSYFLQQHYTSSRASAQALTAYLQSVDVARAKPPTHSRQSQSFPPAMSASEPSLRPPAPVPNR